jgi:hypothetical protein
MGAAERVVGRLEQLAATAEGELTRLRHRVALAALGRDHAEDVLIELDRRGLHHQAWWLRRALG